MNVVNIHTSIMYKPLNFTFNFFYITNELEKSINLMQFLFELKFSFDPNLFLTYFMRFKIKNKGLKPKTITFCTGSDEVKLKLSD